MTPNEIRDNIVLGQDFLHHLRISLRDSQYTDDDVDQFIKQLQIMMTIAEKTENKKLRSMLFNVFVATSVLLKPIKNRLMH